MRTPHSRDAGHGGFTLFEILVATSILVLIVSMLSVIVGQVNKAWFTGQQRVESFQNGRAVLELISRELSQAVISNKLQFVQNPPDLAGGSNLTAMLSGSDTQVANSDSIFWQMPCAGNPYGNICQVGYLLTLNTASKPAQYQLRRYYVQPDNLAPGAAGHMFTIYDSPLTYISSPSYTSATPWPLIFGAPWLTQAQTGSSLAQVKTNFQNSLSVLSDGVIGFWVCCLDKNGNPIPWLCQSSLYNVTAVKFNSAACFLNSSISSGSNSFDTPSGGSTFQYSAPPPATIPANILPDSVQLTLITLDAATIKSGLAIPPPPAVTQPSGVDSAVNTFMSNLVSNHITTARVFSTNVRLVNAGYSSIPR
jgi:type II secretory pathway component PulJ